MIRCNGCARRREALRRFFLPKSKKAPDMPKEPTEKLHAQRSRSGDEWEVVNARNVIQSNGFDTEFEAEEWIREQAKKKAK